MRAVCARRTMPVFTSQTHTVTGMQDHLEVTVFDSQSKKFFSKMPKKP